MLRTPRLEARVVQLISATSFRLASVQICSIDLMVNKKIIVGVAVLVFLTVVISLSLKEFKTDTEIKPIEATEIQQVSTDDPIDIVLDFYGDWLDAVQSTSTDPYQLGLVDEPLLSPELRSKLSNPFEDQLKDPVVCQDPIPEKIRSKRLYELPDEVQIVVFSKEQPLAGQAIATIRRLNDGWYIEDIECSREFDEPREFTFEYEGNLLKSVPPPYDPNYWHLVYSQDGTPGYAVPLFFSTDSQCTDVNRVAAMCDPNQFTETQKVMLRGNMTELGVEVKQLEYIE